MKNVLLKRLSKLRSKQQELQKRREPNIRKRLQDIALKIQELEQKLNQLNSSNLQVSDHALLRYLERVKGMNLSSFKQEILTAELCRLIEQLGGSGQFPIGNAVVRVQDYVVVTVLNKAADALDKPFVPAKDA